MGRGRPLSPIDPDEDVTTSRAPEPEIAAEMGRPL